MEASLIAQMMRTKNPAEAARDLLNTLDRNEAVRSRGRDAVIADELRAWAAENGIKIQRHDKPVVM